MTVAEVIEKLKHFPPNARLVYFDKEEGECDVESLRLTNKAYWRGVGYERQAYAEQYYWENKRGQQMPPSDNATFEDVVEAQ